MYWGSIAALFILGVLGASSVIVKKKPEAKEMIEKLSKISGWVGIVSALWGIWIIIQSVLNLGLLGAGLYGLILWITGLGTGVVLTGLGFIFGYGMITQYMSEEAKKKGEELRQKLVGFQVMFGIVSICLAIWWVLLVLVFVRMF